MRHGGILTTLLHHDIESAEVLVVQLYRWLWDALVNYARKELKVTSGVHLNSLNKVEISRVFEKLMKVRQLNFYNFTLFIGNLLEKGHILEFLVNRVWFHGLILEGFDELFALISFYIVVRNVLIVVNF